MIITEFGKLNDVEEKKKEMFISDYRLLPLLLPLSLIIYISTFQCETSVSHCIALFTFVLLHPLRYPKENCCTGGLS